MQDNNQPGAEIRSEKALSQGKRGPGSKAKAVPAKTPIKSKRSRPLLSALFVLSVIVGCSAIITGLLGARWVSQQLADLSPRIPAEERPPLTLTVQANNNSVIGYQGVYQGRRVEPHELPLHLKYAMISIEDRRFFEHPGIDLVGILRAAWRNYRSGEIIEGGSTLTQQLVKLRYLSGEKTFKRKVHEAALAIEMERVRTKDQILADYLNTVYYGAGAYGIDAAAHRYFAKEVRDLSLAESVMLAGLVQAPSAYNPFDNLEAAHARARQVLVAMVRAGFITSSSAFQSAALLPTPRRRPQPVIEAGYFNDFVKRQSREFFGTATGDVKVKTTIDPYLQTVADRTVYKLLQEQGEAMNASQAALVALSREGKILAMVGGFNYGDSQFNRAVQAKRQPGSIFKSFVYLAALESGWRPHSLVYDAPVTVNGWSPANYGKQYYGRLTLASAFAKSANSVAVRLQENVGRRNVIEMAERLGLDSPLNPYPSLALGTTEVTLLDITGAYAAIADNDANLQPYGIEYAEQRGSVLYERPRTRPRRAYNFPQRDILHLLRSTSQYGTAARVRRAAKEVYGKTGTSQDYRDAWFVGFTDKLVVGVWVGNDDNTSMNKVSGGNLPAEIWASFVEEAQKHVPARQRPPVTYHADNADAPKLIKASTRPAQRREQLSVTGIPRVRSTSVLEIAGKKIQLQGVLGLGGEPAAEMRRFLAGKKVTCRMVWDPVGECYLGNTNLSVVVAFNGGGRASVDAPQNVVQAEAKARQAGRGIWAEAMRAESDTQHTASLPQASTAR